MDAVDALIDQLRLPDGYVECHTSIYCLSGMTTRLVYLYGYGLDALDIWQQFADAVPETGCSPVLIGPLEQVAAFGSPQRPEYLDCFEPGSEGAQWEAEFIADPLRSTIYRRNAEPSIADILRKSQSINAQQWFHKCQQELLDRLGEPALFPREHFFDGDPIRTSESFPDCYLALVPTKDSWQIPAYLPFGNFGDCPPPEVHVAIWKYWHELYGAKIQLMNRNRLEFQLHLPYDDDFDREEARNLELARQGILYCPNLLRGELTSLDRVAAAASYDHWKFCWQEPS
jgi:hypothetical protein